MSSLLGLFGYNKANGTEKLIAVLANAPMIYNSSTGGWNKAAIYLTSDKKAEMRTFLDYAFLVNGTNPNYSFDGTVWSTVTNLSDSPMGFYIETYDVRVYLLDVIIAGTRYYSRCWFSDLPKNNKITWGLETSTDLVQTASSAVVSSATSLFKTRNIKVGDPFLITTGTNAGQYVVQSIDSETQITFTTSLTNSATGSTFWVGGNWFDVQTDDGDVGKGFGKNSNELLVFKRNSLHRYSSRGNELRQVKGAVGTTSRRGIVNIGDDTFYYHPTGIYQYNGVSSKLISNAIEDYIEGVTTANQTEVVSWVEKESIANFYIGDITLRDGITISDCVVSYDSGSQSWSSRSYPFPITAVTTWLESNEPHVYVGDDSSHVYQIDTGTKFDGDPIPFQLETKPYFPAGEDVIVNFDKVRVWIDNGPDVQVLYKLYYKPMSNQKQWLNDEDWRPMIGSQRGSKSEWDFPQDNRRASGIALKFIESSTNESFLLEKFSIYHSNPATR